ncbi:MAG TPA: hypothetical protein VKB76_03800 [Ktedonobacterales bacterium]|nr:hypothetical protein [Ktedonobacterales bacterium]
MTPTGEPEVATENGDATAAQEHAARRQRAITGEATRGLWQRTTFRRAIIEGTVIYAAWRLFVLVPITFWPATLFPLALLVLLVIRFAPPVWATMRVIATRREKMSRRFFEMAGILATACTGVDILIALFVGDPMQPFGGPQYGPDIARLFARAGSHAHPLSIGAFVIAALATWGFLLAYYLIATICTRLAQGGFLRFTMPSGDGRVTL